eukprot:1522512-Rhodomonas_salina.1
MTEDVRRQPCRGIVGVMSVNHEGCTGLRESTETDGAKRLLQGGEQMCQNKATVKWERLGKGRSAPSRALWIQSKWVKS